MACNTYQPYASKKAIKTIKEPVYDKKDPKCDDLTSYAETYRPCIRNRKPTIPGEYELVE